MLAPPVEVVDEDGEVLPALQQVLEVVAAPRDGARHRAPLARRDLRRRRRGRGARRARHRRSPTRSSRPRTCRRRTSARWPTRGALLERVLHHPYTGKAAGSDSRASARGAEHNVLSTDLGQRGNPPVEDGLPLRPTACSRPGSARTRSAPWPSTNTRRLAGRCLSPDDGDRRARRRLRVARRRRDRGRDAGGGTASVIALSYGERGESGELWKEPGQTVERVKELRHAEAEAAAKRAGRDVQAAWTSATTRSSSTRTPWALADVIREFGPDTLITHTDNDPFNPDHPVAFEVTERARALAAGAGVASAFKTITPPRFLQFEPHQPELCNFTPSVFADITSAFEAKQAAMAEMKAQKYLQTYYAQRAEQRGNHARRASGRSEIRHAEAFMRVIPDVVDALLGTRGTRRAGRRVPRRIVRCSADELQHRPVEIGAGEVHDMPVPRAPT